MGTRVVSDVVEKIKCLLAPSWNRNPSSPLFSLYTECSKHPTEFHLTCSYNLDILFGLLIFICGKRGVCYY